MIIMINTIELCRNIWEEPEISQRKLADIMGISLGKVNALLKDTVEKNYILKTETGYLLTDQGTKLLSNHKVDNAIIMAAGFGSRFVPLTFENPKGLVEVFGERMIERLILQLHTAGITDITIVVGYLKEKFEYLIDKYNVTLVYNSEYRTKNNLSTLHLVKDKLKNTYILSSDNWIRDNIFHQYESKSWYSCVMAEDITKEWCVTTNKQKRITDITIGGKSSQIMCGPVYFTKEFSKKIIPYLEEYYLRPGTEDYYWENILIDHLDELDMYVNSIGNDVLYEFDNLEELRQFDVSYQVNSKNKALSCISKILNVPENEITNIRCLKAGMTNKSFLFEAKGESFIFRIPGPGTEKLINRKEEKEVYETIAPLKLSDKIFYFSSETGYKISKYYDGAINSDPHNPEHVKRSMDLLRNFHSSGLKVSHSFDLNERIYFYENLCRQNNCLNFYDYDVVKEHMMQLLSGIEKMNVPQVLCHIDANCDNLLLLPNNKLKLIDWEYAGMCDPLLDISMYALYVYYTEEECDDLLKLYLDREPSTEEIIRYYSYIALGGFLWSMWALYKASQGDEFGEYPLIMYRYAKTYYKKIRLIEENES